MSNKNTPPFLRISTDIAFRILDHLEMFALDSTALLMLMNDIRPTMFSLSYVQACTRLNLSAKDGNGQKFQCLCYALQTDTVRNFFSLIDHMFIPFLFLFFFQHRQLKNYQYFNSH